MVLCRSYTVEGPHRSYSDNSTCQRTSGAAAGGVSVSRIWSRPLHWRRLPRHHARKHVFATSSSSSTPWSQSSSTDHAIHEPAMQHLLPQPGCYYWELSSGENKGTESMSSHWLDCCIYLTLVTFVPLIQLNFKFFVFLPFLEFKRSFKAKAVQALELPPPRDGSISCTICAAVRIGWLGFLSVRNSVLSWIAGCFGKRQRPTPPSEFSWISVMGKPILNEDGKFH